MDLDHLAAIANAMVADNKGLLAADESTGTIGKRLDSISVKSTEDTRRDYREMLFRADGLGEYISGVILYDETIRQNAADGTSLTRILMRRVFYLASRWTLVQKRWRALKMRKLPKD